MCKCVLYIDIGRCVVDCSEQVCSVRRLNVLLKPFLNKISILDRELALVPMLFLCGSPSCLENLSPPNSVLMHYSPKPAPPIFSLSDCW